MSLPYRFVDADNHLWEADDAFTRHVEEKYRSQTFWVDRSEDPRGVCMLGDRVLEAAPHPPLGPDGAPTPPGVARGEHVGEGRFTLDLYRAWQDEYFEQHGNKVPGVDREAHLAGMDSRNTQAAIVFATRGLCVELQLRDQAEPDVVYGAFRGFNRWMQDQWGFNYRGRIFAAPWIPLLDPDMALRELERVLAEGARAVSLNGGKRLDGKSIADPDLDRFWGLMNEAGTLAAYHTSNAGEWREFRFSTEGDRVFGLTAIQKYPSDRAIMDTLAMLILQNMFGRFPKLRVATLENGSEWVPYLLRRLDLSAKIVDSHDGPWPQGKLDALPSEIFREHVLVSPFAEEDLPALIDTVGANCVAFGSDFPHTEDSVPPDDYLVALGGQTPQDTQAIMRDNVGSILQLI